MILDDLLAGRQYKRPQKDKERVLLPELKMLVRHHVDNCVPYARIVRYTAPALQDVQSLAELPYIPAGLFKTHKLQSVADNSIGAILTSSGTGGVLSRIAIDAVTAKYQARGLAAVMQEAIGPGRLPMLIIEQEETIMDRSRLSARAVGVLGMMAFGRAPLFAVDEAMRLKMDAVKDFVRRHGRAPFLIFGFTSIVWKHFLQNIIAEGMDLSLGILIHGGGWKKLENEKVDSTAFRKAFAKSCGLNKIYNYYGMIEQPGMICLEGSDGCVYPPAFGEVIIRDPQTWEALPPGCTRTNRVKYCGRS